MIFIGIRNANAFFAVIASLVLWSASDCRAEDWRQFRGPNGTGVVDSVSGKQVFNFSAENAKWTTPIPGTGWSSPVVSENRIWLTTAETTPATQEEIAAKTKDVQFAKIKTAAGSIRLRAVCVAADSGKVIHNLLLANVDDPDLINPLNSYASPTPAIVGGRVVCHFGSYGTWCLDAETGETLWKTQLIVDHSVGPGSSPVVAGDIVLITCDGIDRQFVAGLKLASGEKAWETNRPAMRTTNGEFRKAYSTPLVIEVEGQKQAVIPGAQWICSYDPASGKELWRADYGDGFSTTPMPLMVSGMIVCSTGYMAGNLVAINPKGTGDISGAITWRAKGGSTMPTAVAKAGFIYSVSDNGVLAVLEAKSGRIVHRVRVGGKFASSPLLIGNTLYLGNQDGDLSVYEVSEPGAKPVAKSVSRLDGSIMASPAVIDSDMVIRTSQSLTRFSAQ